MHFRRAARDVHAALSESRDTWTALGSNLITTREHLDQLIARADGIFAGLQQGKGTVGTFLTDSSAADELKSLLAKANRSMEELQLMATNLHYASANMQLASTNLPAITEAIGNEARELPGLVMQTQTSMRELERLIEAAQRHWLLRKYVNKTNPPPTRPLFEAAKSEQKPLKPFRSPRD